MSGVLFHGKIKNSGSKPLFFCFISAIILYCFLDKNS